MTHEPGETDAALVRLPAGIDTLEALRLAKRLQDAGSHARNLIVEASEVEEIGLAGLQFLAVLGAALAREHGSLTLANPSPALQARIAQTGMGRLLLAEPAANHDSATPRQRLSFTDAALDYGREPAEALRRLHESGVAVVAILPDLIPSVGAIEADRILLRFDLHVPVDTDPAALSDALAEFGGDALVDAASPSADAAPGPGLSPAEPLSDTQSIKIERLMADVEELMMRHAAIVTRAPSLDRALVAELKAMGDGLRTLQENAIAVGLSPLGMLLQRPVTAEASHGFPGWDIEIEPAVIGPVLPALAPLLARTPPNSLSAQETKGVLTIEIAGASMPPGLETAVAAVRGRAAVLSTETGPVLRLELPRSRAMLEALIVGAGAQIGAIPVDRAVEILRPEPADLASVGSGSHLMRFRGAYLPLVDLAAALAGGSTDENAEATIVVVVQSDAGDFGIRVREVTDHRQIMVKPLDGTLPAGAGVVGLSFSTGGIAMVLDVDMLRLATLGSPRSA